MSFPVSKFNLKAVRRGRMQRFKEFKPQLTSLIDVMTCLLIYLLQSFSAEGEIVTTTKDLLLPESSAQKRPQLNTVITVNNSYILAEDVAVATVDEVLANQDLVIPALSDWLEKRRTETEQIAKNSTKLTFKGDVTIRGDKRIHFRLLKKIMYTCGQQGFSNFSLAVLKKE
jgi:biopolymer transport protein ExbD